MNLLYVLVTLATVVANGFMAVGDLLRFRFVLDNAARTDVPESWLPVLGVLKAAGALGLLLGLVGVPLIGTAAAAGLTLFFIGAIAAHLRARNYSLVFPVAYLSLAVAALALGVTA